MPSVSILSTEVHFHIALLPRLQLCMSLALHVSTLDESGHELNTRAHILASVTILRPAQGTVRSCQDGSDIR